MKKILVVMLLAIVTPVLINAASSDIEKILKVEVTEDFFTIYSIDGDFGKQECTTGNPIAFRVSDFPNSHDKMLSIALSAYVSGKKVSMWFSGCQNSPWSGTMPKPTSIVIQD